MTQKSQIDETLFAQAVQLAAAWLPAAGRDDIDVRDRMRVFVFEAYQSLEAAREEIEDWLVKVGPLNR